MKFTYTKEKVLINNSGDVKICSELKKKSTKMQIKLTRTICSTYTPQCGKNVVACQKVNRECVWGMLNLSRKQENKVTVL